MATLTVKGGGDLTLRQVSMGAAAVQVLILVVVEDGLVLDLIRLF